MPRWRAERNTGSWYRADRNLRGVLQPFPAMLILAGHHDTRKARVVDGQAAGRGHDRLP